MATTRQATFCPKCNGETTGAAGNVCPHCKSPLRAEANPFFGSPDYLWHQREALLDSADASRSTAKTKATDRRKIDEINEAFVQWLRGSTFDDKLAAMRDAQLTLQHLLYCPLSVNEIRQLIVVAKSIGKLGEAYENVFRHGGTLYDGKVGHIPAFREGSDGSDEATR